MKTHLKEITLLGLAALAILITSVPSSAYAERDNNPPGPVGGPGANWENPRGPYGGPGASPDRHHKHAKHWLEKHPEVKAKIDTNGDGVLDKNEKTAARKEFREKKFENFLANHPNMKKEMDTNNDGTVDDAERKAAREKGAEKWFDNHPKIKEKADTNHDGTIDQAEKKAAKQQFRENHPNKRRWRKH